MVQFTSSLCILNGMRGSGGEIFLIVLRLEWLVGSKRVGCISNELFSLRDEIDSYLKVSFKTVFYGGLSEN